MALGLGIDTGGTYTDGVLFDFESGKVLERAKRQTTPQDLSIGICALLDALPQELLSQVALVSLSTTLATNACVENRGSRVALFLMGYNPKLVGQLSEEYGLSFAGEVHCIAGSHTQRGEPLVDPDYQALDRLCDEVRGRVDAIGVAEYWGIRNPEYERRAKKRIRERTGLPVAAAHELTNEINSMRRAATTLINARLIPLIGQLMSAVREALDQRGVRAPLMIVRGDGSLMTDSFAREYPVETLLSGPASSVTGAMRLCRERDIIAVDIGGTTTDLAIVRSGRTSLASDGVDVGQWRTGTRAIQIKTIGLGGDSAIDRSDRGELTLGPRRAVPLCVLASEHPQVREALNEMLLDDREQSYARGVFYLLVKQAPEQLVLEGDERAAIEALQAGPLSKEQLAARIGTRPYFIKLDRLEGLGVVMRSMLTPTDLMHVRGDFTAFDREASALGLRLLAAQLSLTGEQLSERVMDMAAERLYGLVASFLLERALGKAPQEPVTLGLGYRPRGDELKVCLTASYPLVGIGAPTAALLPKAAERLHTRCILPEDYQVANAVGAITGSVMVEELITIKPHYDASGIVGYSAHSSENRFYHEDLDACQQWAEQEARRIARDKALQMGAAQVELEMEDGSQSGQAGGVARQTMLLEKWVIARAVGRVSIL